MIDLAKTPSMLPKKYASASVYGLKRKAIYREGQPP
jgi:hypothetical protein